MKLLPFPRNCLSVVRVLPALLVLLCLGSVLNAAYQVAAFDQGKGGIIYTYRDTATTGQDPRSWQIWLPPTDKPIRGLLIDGNAGTGNGLGGTLEDSLQAFATKYNFGLMASSGISGSSTYSTHAVKIVEAISQIGTFAKRPELATVPFITHGSSSAGANAYGLAMKYPERTICFTSNVIAGLNPNTPSDAGIKVPGMMVIGEVDNIVNNQQTTRTFMDTVRPRGALWSRIIIQGMGHEHRRVVRLFYVMWEKCLHLRLPADWDPLSGAPVLRPVSEADGWLIDDASALTGFPTVQPANNYTGNKAGKSWYIDETMARLASGYAAYNQYGTFSIEGIHNYPGYNNIPPPESAQSTTIDLIRPGTQLKLVYEPGNKTWKKVRFYKGMELLGERVGGEEPTLTTTLQPDAIIQQFTAVVTDGEDLEHPVIGQTVMMNKGRDAWLSARKFGWYYEGFAPWYYHADLGWIFPSDEAKFGDAGGYYVFYWDASAWYYIYSRWMPWGVDMSKNPAVFVELPITPAP
ncbi:MAG: hypothetical protein SFY80_13775 [Verrucomicrobiota bacterium]|nr:hypothetical protein [Verrucomicrobiota bacterium]